MMVQMTPQAAGWLLQFRYHDEGRKLNMDIVTAFARRIIGGEFTSTPPIRFLLEGGLMKLTNGQHRLCGIIEAGKAVPLEIEWEVA